VLAVTFADLIFRARQFFIAIVGVGLVLAMGLILSGLASGFHAELDQTVKAVGADSWVVSSASAGRVTAFAAFQQSAADAMKFEPGVTQAYPFLLVPLQVAHSNGQPVTINLLGVSLGGLGDPTPESGRALAGPDDAVVNARMRTPIGAELLMGGRTLHVVGIVHGRTVIGGISNVYVPIATAQQIAVGGRPLITAVVTRGVPRGAPHGLLVRSPDQLVTASVAQLGSAVSSINNTRLIMWTVAAIIVASLLYIAALERKRDFAVLKALGSSSAALFGSLMLEAVVVTLLATVLAEFVANLLTPLFAQPIDIELSSYLTLPIIAVVVGLLASLVALRRATGADPAAAFA
jgi:putative ABC transport system permease protein